jgi:hypothetical protein
MYELSNLIAMRDSDSPTWFRSVQIGCGLVSLVLSSLIFLLGFPTPAADFLITILSIALLSVGIERIFLGLLLFGPTSHAIQRQAKSNYLTNLALGIFALIFAVVALVFPVTVIKVPGLLLSISLSVMFNGFGRIFQGAMARGQPRSIRLVSLGLGSLSIGTSIFVGNSHIFGIIFPIRILLVVLIIQGLALIIFGIIGRYSIEQVLRK